MTAFALFYAEQVKAKIVKVGTIPRFALPHALGGAERKECWSYKQQVNRG